MAATTFPQAASSAPVQSPRQVPWYVWSSVIAVTSAIVGVHWDISWHRSIGRDTFWTPAHICIHVCGVLAGITCAWLILSTTFDRSSPLRDASVRMWGFRGPLGAFICAWGGVAMITSAPFDNWWHNAYGLDVKILSPPHLVLAAGVIAVALGSLILTLGCMNRAGASARKQLERVFFYIASMLLMFLIVLEMELIGRSYMHMAHFYRIVATVVPIILAAVSVATGYRWAATTVAGIYTLFWAATGWILPLFPAEPKLGPVYQHVTRFVPPEFPLLIIVPAIALDLLWRQRWNRWLLALVSGLVFVAVFLAAQWPFGTFLQSPGARNWFFGAHWVQYNYPPSSRYVQHIFYDTEQPAVFRNELLLAIAIGAAGTRLGMAWGSWMRRVQR